MSETAAEAELADLRSFYEVEAEHQLRGEPNGRRVELRERFVETVLGEGRSFIVDFGSGPASDGPGFAEHGIDYVGLDLAHGNATLARTSGHTVVQGSIVTPPIRPAAFDAGWSMSTLMHLTADHASAAAGALARTVRSGGPVCIGVWGGSLGSLTNDFAIEGQQRPFHLRSLAENERLFTSDASIDRTEIWDRGPDGWEYQVFHLRAA